MCYTDNDSTLNTKDNKRQKINTVPENFTNCSKNTRYCHVGFSISKKASSLEISVFMLF